MCNSSCWLCQVFYIRECNTWHPCKDGIPTSPTKVCAMQTTGLTLLCLVDMFLCITAKPTAACTMFLCSHTNFHNPPKDANVSSCAPQEGGKQASNFGQLLLGFFRRFGSHFNLYSDAVAIGLGGIVSKKSACVSGEDISTPKLCVQDINTLRSVTKLTCDFSCCCVPLSGSALH